MRSKRVPAGVTRVVLRHPWLEALTRPLVEARRTWLGRRRRRVDDLRARLVESLPDDPVVRLPDFEGEFALDARSHLFGRLLSGAPYEPGTRDCCARDLDQARDATDVGASVSFFTVRFSRHHPRRRVLALEPAPAAVGRLRRNLVRSGVEDATIVVEAAAGDRVERRSRWVADGPGEYSTLAQQKHWAVAGRATERRNGHGG